jgi:hypothetical protein
MLEARDGRGEPDVSAMNHVRSLKVLEELLVMCWPKIGLAVPPRVGSHPRRSCRSTQHESACAF